MALTTAFPDDTNTGVTSGTKLVNLTASNLPTGVQIDSGGNFNITKAGLVLSGYNISGNVTISAANVTIQNCSVTSATDTAVVKIADGITGAIVQNNTINGVGTGNDGSFGIEGSGTFIGNNITNVENGIGPGSNSLIQNNYIHNLLASGSPHYDGIQMDGGLSNITINHNTVINDQGQTSAVMIDNYFGAINNISVTNNLLIGGGYTIYDDAQFNSNPINGVTISGNHIGGGYYGSYDFNGTNPTVSGNVLDGANLQATLDTPVNDSLQLILPTTPTPVLTNPTPPVTPVTPTTPVTPVTPIAPTPPVTTNVTDHVYHHGGMNFSESHLTNYDVHSLHHGF